MKRSHPLKDRWYNMKNRCDKPSNTDYPNYGGRGITVHPEFYSFPVFVEYVEGLPNFDLSLELDRRDNDKGYEPGNLRWVTSKVNVNNSRTIKHSDEEVLEALDRFGLAGGKIYTALRKLTYEGFSVGVERLAGLSNFQPTSSSPIDIAEAMKDYEIYLMCGSYGMKALRKLGLRVSQTEYYRIRTQVRLAIDGKGRRGGIS